MVRERKRKEFFFYKILYSNLSEYNIEEINFQQGLHVFLGNVSVASEHYIGQTRGLEFPDMICKYDRNSRIPLKPNLKPKN